MLRYRTSAAKLRAPVHKSDIHPLATSGKNEALIGDLKDGLLDFLDQLGHKDGDYDSRLWFGGGDGMSYNNMLILKKYMQTHADQFQRFELMRPILQVWHTQWTNLTRIIQTHSGESLSNNPATIRWAAKKIGRDVSGDKKSDFYPDSQLLALLHDTQMLDGWRYISTRTPSGILLLMRNNPLLRVYFKTDDIIQYLDKKATIPSFEELEIGAKFLFDAFTSSKAQYEAMDDARDNSIDWAKSLPFGSAWDASAVRTSNFFTPMEIANAQKQASHAVLKKKNLTKKSPGADPADQPFFGDRVFAEAVMFKRDAMFARELAYVTSEGDVGRMWECIKVCHLCFDYILH